MTAVPLVWNKALSSVITRRPLGIQSVLTLLGDGNCLSGAHLANLEESGITAQITKPWQ